MNGETVVRVVQPAYLATLPYDRRRCWSDAIGLSPIKMFSEPPVSSHQHLTVDPRGEQYVSRAGTFRPTEVVDLRSRFCSARERVLWPEAVSLTDSTLFNASLIRGYRQVSDLHLLGLAKKMGGYLATFDAGIPLSAVIGATRDTIAVISSD